MPSDDPIDEKAWLRALKLDDSAPPEQADPSPARVDAMLRHLPPDGEISPEVLEATERAWREEARSQQTIHLSAPIAPPARRRRWITWGPALAAAATFLVLLVRPILFVNPLQWQTAVAVASVRGDTNDTATRRAAMEAWMSRLEKAVREGRGSDKRAARARINASMTEMPDGALQLRVDFSGHAGTPPLEVWIPTPLDLPAAEAALQKASADILRALTGEGTKEK